MAKLAHTLGWPGIRIGLRKLSKLFHDPLFYVVFIYGNLLMFVGAFVFDHFERGVNPQVLKFLDSFEWSVSVVSTVGNAAAQPVTDAGKWLAIVMMMLGSLFLWTFMGLIVGVLLSPDFGHLEREIKKEEALDQQVLKELKQVLEKLTKSQ